MIRRRITSALVLARAPQFALSQELPMWSPHEICATASAPGHGALSESRFRNAVSGSWGVLLEAAKRGCLAAVKSPLDQSRQLLGQCIDMETLKGVHRRAVATAATPAEPVPAPKPDEGGAPGTSLPVEPPKSPN